MKFIVICLFLVLYTFNVTAQGLFSETTSDQKISESKGRIEFSGFGRGSVYGGSKSFDFASAFGEFCLKSEFSRGFTFFFSDVRFRSGLQFGDQYSLVQLKEVYAGYKSDKLDFSFGNQIISWGRADGFNPTNNITPNDYFFLTSDPDDQKLPDLLARMKIRISGETNAELIWVPFYRPSIYRYDLFNMGQNVSFAEILLPEKTFRNGSAAVKFNAEFSGLGFSFSWFRGYDPFHGFAIKSIDWTSGKPMITNQPEPYLKNTLGADFAIPVSKWIIRGEMAYDITENPARKMNIPGSNFSLVAGLERNFNGWNTIIQYAGKITPTFEKLEMPVLIDPANPVAQMNYATALIRYESELFNRKIFYQQKKTNHALMVNLTRSVFHEAGNMEITAYYNLTSDDYFVRPKITWKPADALSVCIGGSFMNGPEKSVFSYSHPVMNGFFLEMKAMF